MISLDFVHFSLLKRALKHLPLHLNVSILKYLTRDLVKNYNISSILMYNNQIHF